MLRKYLGFLKSKTVWAGIIAAAQQIVSADVVDANAVVSAATILLGAVGVRDAIGKRV